MDQTKRLSLTCRPARSQQPSASVTPDLTPLDALIQSLSVN